MTNYERVLPRDLFNESALLKAHGRLWILLGENRGHNARFEEETVPFFDIMQDQASGAIGICNLTFTVDGVTRLLQRPLNSRDSWSLWVEGGNDDPDFESVQVFDEDGNLTDEMRRLIGLDAEDPA